MPNGVTEGEQEMTAEAELPTPPEQGQPINLASYVQVLREKYVANGRKKDAQIEEMDETNTLLQALILDLRAENERLTEALNAAPNREQRRAVKAVPAVKAAPRKKR